MLLNEDFSRIAQSSLYLHERIEGLENSSVMIEPEMKDVQQRVHAWVNVLGGKGVRSLEHRLARSGLRPAAIPRLLSDLTAYQLDFPSWMHTLKPALALFEKWSERTPAEIRDSAAFLLTQDPIPFEHFTVPFVASADEILRRKNAAYNERLSEAARLCLQRYLAVLISKNATPTLAVRFDAYKLSKGWRNNPTAKPLRLDSYYEQFIQGLFNGSLPDLVRSFPVLARRIGETIETWIDVCSEFLQRLDTDIADIGKLFADSEPLGKVIHIDTWLSDPHRGGRVVLCLTFGTGMKCIYKPKDVRTEQVFQFFMEKVSRRASLSQHKNWKVLSRGAYGWVEYISSSPCVGASEAGNFYRRMGMLLCMAHILNATDIHGENLIAVGEHPVPIDLETILTPEISAASDASLDSATAVAKRLLWENSVMRLCLLPRWAPANDNDWDRDSAIFMSGDPGKIIQNRWIEINTDRMRRESVERVRTHLSHIPHLNGMPVPAAGYLDEILAGFEETYGAILADQENLAKDDNFLFPFYNAHTRFIYRNTYVYGKVIERLCQPDCMISGLNYSIQSEVFFKSVVPLPPTSAGWQIAAAEQRAVLRGDIPVFECNSDHSWLADGNGSCVNDFFSLSGVECFKRRIATLSNDDFDQQVSFIRASLYNGQTAMAASTIDAAGRSAALELDQVGWAQWGAELIKSLCSARIEGANGSATWIGRVFDEEKKAYRIKVLGGSLYDGIAGVAVAVAAGASKFKNDLFGRTLDGCYRYFDGLIREQRLAEPYFGGALGIPSIAYSLAKIATLSQETRWLDLALRCSGYVSPEAIEKDQKYDLMQGTGGCLLAMLALYSLSSDKSFLDKAIECGEHILKSRSASDTGLRAWKTNGLMMLGFSHGAAGIAYSLCRLYCETGESKYLAAAKESCLYEASFYSEAKHNWPNLSQKTQDGGFSFWNTWCHGATGIAIGRLGCFQCTSDREFMHDVENVLAHTEDQELDRVDHLCCGNFGKVELLLLAGSLLEKQIYISQAHQLALNVIRRADERGSYALGDYRFPNPTFHQGNAGIAYALLRLEDPNSLPSILTWS